MSRDLPEEVTNGMPDDLRESIDLIGADVADADEDVRLYGPPGTGKTTQSSLRTAVAAIEENIPPRDMTVVTYRTSLADAMKERLTDEWAVFPSPGDAESDTPYKYWATMHAVANRATGFVEAITGAQNPDSLAGMVEHKSKQAFADKHDLGSVKPSKPWYTTPFQAFHDLYSYSKQNLLDVGTYRNVPDDVLRPPRSDRRAYEKLQTYRDHWDVEFDRAVDAWEAWKHEHDVHDFWEQLDAALGVDLSADRYLVIDEYHDVYPLMHLVAAHWIGQAETAIVAGDPDQTINGFSGADPAFFERLDEAVDKRIPIVQLQKSYRVPAQHYAAALRVLSQERDPPQVRPDGQGLIYEYALDGEYVNDTNTDTWQAVPEAQTDGSAIQLWRNYGPDIMYLSRTQYQLDGIGRELDMYGIVYDSQDGVAGDWERRLSLMRGLREVRDYRTEKKREKEEYGITNRSAADIPVSQDDALTLLQHSHRNTIDSDIDTIRADYYDEDTHLTLADHVSASWWSRYGDGTDSISELTRLADRDVQAMRAAWTRYRDADEWTLSALGGGTRIWTIHASKGAEASDIVLYDGITRNIRDGIDDHKEEAENEARTWYVALTRAKHRIHLVRGGFDSMKPHLPDDLRSRATAAAEAAAEKGGESA